MLSLAPALTQKPDVFVPETLEPGRQATLICVFNWAFEECPAPALSWTGVAVTPQGPGPKSSYFSVLSLTPRPHDHGTHLTCRADFSREGVSAETTVQLNVTCESGGQGIRVCRQARRDVAGGCPDGGVCGVCVESQSPRLSPWEGAWGCLLLPWPQAALTPVCHLWSQG